jgi:hypothetical protein
MVVISLLFCLYNENLKYIIHKVIEYHKNRIMMRDIWRFKSPINYKQFSFLCKIHKNIYINIDFDSKMVRIELALPVDERTDADNLLKTLRKEMDHLAEITPLPPKQILDDFATKFKDYKDISKPSETNGLTKIDVYTDTSKNSNTSRSTTGILLSSTTVTPRQASTPIVITRQVTPDPKVETV